MKRLINIPIVYLSDVIDDMIIDNEGGYTISKALVNELSEIEDDPEKMAVADHIFTAIFGWSLDTFCKRVNEHFIKSYLDSIGFNEEQVNYLLDNHLEETLGILTNDLPDEEAKTKIAALCKLNMKPKMKEIIDSRMNDLWSELYAILEEATGKEYSGDISPDDSLKLDGIQDDILNLFLSVSKNNEIKEEEK